LPLAAHAENGGWIVQAEIGNLVTVESREAAIVVECDPAVRQDGRSAYSLSVLFPTATYDGLLAPLTPDMREAVAALGVNVSVDHGPGPRAFATGTVSPTEIAGYSLLAVTGFSDTVHNFLFLTQLDRVLQTASETIDVRISVATGDGGRSERLWSFTAEGAAAALAYLRERCGRGFMR